MPDVKETITNTANGAYSYAHRSLDHYLPPSTRQEAYDNVQSFAHTRPILFSALVAQALLCSVPFLIFAGFALFTLLFSFGAALLFSLFWIGVELMILIPALLLASFVAVLLWAWALSTFLSVRWLYIQLLKADSKTLDHGEGQQMKTE